MFNILSYLPIICTIWLSYITLSQLYISLPSIEEISYCYHFLNGNYTVIDNYSTEINPNLGFDSNVCLFTQGTGNQQTSSTETYSYAGVYVNTNNGDMVNCDRTNVPHGWSRMTVLYTDYCGDCFNCKKQILRDDYYTCYECSRRLCVECNKANNFYVYYKTQQP